MSDVDVIGDLKVQLLSLLVQKHDGGGFNPKQGNHPFYGESQQKIEVMDRTQRLADLAEHQQLVDVALRWQLYEQLRLSFRRVS
jgi:hypothetical protein